MANKKSSCACTVCGSTDTVFVLHSDADIYRCRGCSHNFTDPASIVANETYSADYYIKAHKNWFENPNTTLFAWIHARLAKTTASLLDVGCGNGAFLKYTKAHVPAVKRLVGVDYAPNDSTPDIEFFTGDAADVPGNETFDAVVSLAVIEHVPDPVGFARLMADRCKQGGYVVTMTVNNDSILNRLSRLLYNLGMPTAATRIYSSHHLQHFTVASLRSTLERAGLQIVTTHTHNSPLAAIDLPDSNIFKKGIFVIGIIGVSILGSLTGTAYLQTLVARKI